MAVPTTRKEFIDVCMRELGRPAVNIELDADQIDDRIDEALSFYNDYLFDGAEKVFYKYQVTSTDIANSYLTLPDNIIGAVNIFPISSMLYGQSMFDVRYQIALNDMWTFTSTSMIPYYMTFAQLQFIEQLLIGQQPIRYNRNSNILHIDMNWNTKINPGEYIVVEAYQVVDPDVYPKMWGDRWLKKYAVQLLKRQWGTNLKKYSGMTLPGGTQFNGQIIYDEADKEIERLEEEMKYSADSLPGPMIG
jgi:transposase